VLEAAHIRPYANGGEHSLSNGLLLRSDLHRLFDKGYLTIDPDNTTIEVSRRLKDEFDNGEEYYRLRGQSIRMPEDPRAAPARENLLYHAQHVFR
jgi:putative restriction endonuclease